MNHEQEVCFHGDLDYKRSLTQRVCRSTLAAEAAHLADAVEASDWLAVLLAEALEGDVNLKDCIEIVNRRHRVYVTDAQSDYDYLQKDGTSPSKDKRMAIEGELHRETFRRPNALVRWVDGLQNIADILTEAEADEAYFRQIINDSCFTLVQSEGARKIKEKKRSERLARKADETMQAKTDAERHVRGQMIAEQVDPGGELQRSHIGLSICLPKKDRCDNLWRSTVLSAQP